MEYRDSEANRQAGITYHMAITDEWTAQKAGPTYLPGAFEGDGFIHCTNGIENMIAVGNRFYASDLTPLTVLVVKTDAVQSPVRYDDPQQDFPHIYGPLNVDAVIGELRVHRADDGTFTEIGR